MKVTQKEKRIICWIAGLVLFSIFYLFILKQLIEIDTGGMLRHIPVEKIKVYFLPRIILYVADYFTFIPFFITCLLYIKKRKVGFYICGVITLVLIALCLKYNLPLFPRNLNPYRMLWKVDILEYFFSIIYAGMFLFILFFPFFHDLLQRFHKGKKALIIFSLGAAISINILSVVNLLFNGIEYFDKWTSVIFVLITLIKVGILVCIYHLFVKEKEMEPDLKKMERCFILKMIIPVLIIFLFMLFKINWGNNYFTIYQNEKIDGYLFFGNVEAFIEQYEIPYQEKRQYFDIEQVSENRAEGKSVVDWYYLEDEKKLIITTYGRKLEAFYYLEPYNEQECMSSNSHSFELTKRMELNKEMRVGEYRAVLSLETYSDTVFQYSVRADLTFPPFRFETYDSHGRKWKRDIEKYDILIEGKEIPAYFLGMVKYYGIIKVEPFTHYWGENYFERWQENPIKLKSARQY